MNTCNIILYLVKNDFLTSIHGYGYNSDQKPVDSISKYLISDIGYIAKNLITTKNKESFLTLDENIKITRIQPNFYIDVYSTDNIETIINNIVENIKKEGIEVKNIFLKSTTTIESIPKNVKHELITDFFNYGYVLAKHNFNIGKMFNKFKTDTCSFYNVFLHDGKNNIFKPKKPHALLSNKRIIYPYDNEELYNVMGYNSTIDIGKKSYKVLQGLVKINKDNVVQDIISQYLKLRPYSDLSCILEYNSIYDITLQYLYTVHREKTFSLDKHGNLLGYEGLPLITRITPQALMYNAINSVKTLGLVLNSIKHLEKEDITHLFYKDKKCIVAPDQKILKIKKGITIVLGEDFIIRNSLRALEGKEPKVFLLYKEIKQVTYYYFYVEIQDNEFGIFTNNCSNVLYGKLNKK